jgi:indole-3-glycerol phosphate synthase
MSILDDIAAYKRGEITKAKSRCSIASLQSKIAKAGPPREFRKALLLAKSRQRYGLIAEIKKASPSKGIIRENFDPADVAQLSWIARAYKDGGATCLSVLTDGPSFQGDLSFIKPARAASNLPVLRKDFMLDPYQVIEARAHDADCILVILAMVEDPTAGELIQIAHEYGMDVLVEVHDEQELDRALGLGATMIGINNRDLRTFVTDLAITVKLAPRIPSDVLVVAESGLSRPSDLRKLAGVGVTTFLVGESLMREQDVRAATSALLMA